MASKSKPQVTQVSEAVESRYYTGPVSGPQAQVAAVTIALRAEHYLKVGNGLESKDGVGVADWKVYREHGRAISAILTETNGEITPEVLTHAAAIIPAMKSVAAPGDGFAHVIDRTWTWVSLPADKAPDSKPAGWFLSGKRSTETVATYFAKTVVSEADAKTAFGIA